MSRWSPYDTEEARLPEGMTRVGYDADEQVYTFRDSDGSYWESAPGNRYGRLTKVSGPASDDDRAPFLGGGTQPDDDASSSPRASWRHDMMPMLNFGVIVGVCLLLLFWFMSVGTSGGKSFSCPGGMSAYTIHGGDTCWKISEEHGLTVDELVTGNTGLDCDALQVGSQICIPPSSSASSEAAQEAPGV